MTEAATLSATTAIELKGTTFTLSVLKVKTTHVEHIQANLMQKIAQAPHFFVRLPLVLDLSPIETQPIDLLKLKRMLEALDLIVVGIIRHHTETNQQAHQIGLAVLSHKESLASKKKPEQPKNGVTEFQTSTKVVHRNIRSGQQVFAAKADLIIFGHVSNGAEVIADGSIHIYGPLRGKAMAGASGQSKACIVTQSLEAELVSIAGNYWLSDTLGSHAYAKKSCYIQCINETLSIAPLPS
jgi:septum site-determining protein MinC